jgi:hypothetical protein
MAIPSITEWGSPFEDQAIFECARLSFIGVADQVFLIPWLWR